jgi:hypothetical protein
MAIDGTSAHIGEEIELHYSWHPLYGRWIRRHYSEQRIARAIRQIFMIPSIPVRVSNLTAPGPSRGSPQYLISWSEPSLSGAASTSCVS